jgi:hypothetical protein
MPPAPVLCALLLLAPFPQDAGWLIVRGRADLPPPLSYEKVASLYLHGHAVRIVGADEAGAEPSASRMVIGTPSDNALAGTLAQRLGLAIDGERAVFHGQEYGPDTGFVLVADDVDGGGRLAVLTAAGAAGLFACFTVPIDVAAPGFTIARRQAKVASGPLYADVDTSRPVVVRLDLDLEYLARSAEGWARGDRDLRVTRGLAGYEHVYTALAGPYADLSAHVRATLDDEDGSVSAARRAFAGRDLSREILDAYARCAKALGGRRAPAPVIYVVADPLAGTNGKNFDPDPLSGRLQVVLNLVVLARAGNFETVVLHECLHTFQTTTGVRAVDRAAREGVATLATQVLEPALGDAEALMWTPAELAAAEARRDALVAAFQQSASTTDAERLRAWFNLDGTLDDVPGAPPRSGYYVAWLAARAWRVAHPGSGLAELFAASADELLAALP